MKRRLMALGAVALFGLGILGGRLFGPSTNPTDNAAAQTVNTAASSAADTSTLSAGAISTSAIDKATIGAYTTAGKSVVYVESKGVGSGSGIIFDTRGDIVTNHHVVVGATSLSVTLANGKSYPATLVGSDTSDDLAVIHINASGLTPAHFAGTGGYQVGQMVLAIGSPLGLQGSVTSGLISGVHRVEQEQNGAYLSDAVQTSAPINPGNSGGALVTLGGVVVGMPTLEQTSSTSGEAAQNIGFAIPSERITSIATQIIATGHVQHTGRAYLGIAPTDGTSGLGGGFFGGGGQAPSTTQGALVSQVSSNGPAGKAGIQQGDVITAANGTTVTNAQDLLTVLAREKPGDHITLKIDRNGSTQDVTVTLGELPASTQ